MRSGPSKRSGSAALEVRTLVEEYTGTAVAFQTAVKPMTPGKRFVKEAS
jgi:hypothetical protein